MAAKPKQNDLYKPKPAPKPVARKEPAKAHLCSDERLKTFARKALDDLKVPGAIPSEVILTALGEVRDEIETKVLTLAGKGVR